MAWFRVSLEGEVDTLRIITEKKQLIGVNMDLKDVNIIQISRKLIERMEV